MSVVACRVFSDHVEIAADTQITYSESAALNVKECKIVKINADMVLAAAGNPEDMTLFRRFLVNKYNNFKNIISSPTTVDQVLDLVIEFKQWASEVGKDIAHNGHFETDYILLSSYKAFIIEGFHVRGLEIGQFHALGDGMATALGALEVGASVSTAVKAACKYNIYCSEPIVTYDIP